MNYIQKRLRAIDQFQQRYRFTAFTYAVIKKYGEDQAGYQSALLTYYGFLSLFPLLLVLTTLTGIIASSHPDLQHSIIHGLTNYIPVLGNQLSSHVQGIHKTGIALLVGILFTFYGARGVADVFRNGVNHLWRVPLTKRDGFPKSLIKNLIIIVGGGLGLILASAFSGLAAAAGQGLIFRLLSLLVNVAILFGLFSWLLNTALPQQVSFKDIRAGALTAAVGLVLLQSFGALLLTRELKSLDAVYSYFAIALGLLFWLYLQSQVVYYSVEVAAVHTQKLWPRSLTDDHLTKADKVALDYQAKEARALEREHVQTHIHHKKRN
jgi:YihY family inner membrane protein